MFTSEAWTFPYSVLTGFAKYLYKRDTSKKVPRFFYVRMRTMAFGLVRKINSFLAEFVGWKQQEKKINFVNRIK
jgi:hypothetical protein